MRKKLKFLIPIGLILLIGFMVLMIVAKIIEKEKITEQIQTLPPFAFTNIKTGQIFTDNSIVPAKAILIIHFHPDCDFCHEQMEEISKQLESFDNFQILLISHARASEIESFAATSDLTNKENIILLEDKDLIFNEIFGKSGVPTSLVYSSSGKLINHFKGKTNEGELLKCLNE